MAKGYWIVRGEVTNPEQYKDYVAANAAPRKTHGGRFLVRGGSSKHPKATTGHNLKPTTATPSPQSLIFAPSARSLASSLDW